MAFQILANSMTRTTVRSAATGTMNSDISIYLLEQVLPIYTVEGSGPQVVQNSSLPATTPSFTRSSAAPSEPGQIKV
jgi:hypothetical protein